MNFLEEKIVKEGVVKKGNILKVDSFLNHQMDVKLFRQMGEEFKKRFADKPINKILTVEASGIGIACIVAECFDLDVVVLPGFQSVQYPPCFPCLDAQPVPGIIHRPAERRRLKPLHKVPPSSANVLFSDISPNTAAVASMRLVSIEHHIGLRGVISVCCLLVKSSSAFRHPSVDMPRCNTFFAFSRIHSHWQTFLLGIASNMPC